MKNTLLYRGDEELNLLINMLKPKSETKKILDINNITAESILSECKVCPDIIERKAPFGSGANKVMIILNAPRMANRIEINIHRAESVGLLKKMVSAIGLEMKECYVTNLIKCETSSALIKPSDMVKNCTKVLQKEIDIIKPGLVIVMGDILPLQGIVNSSKGITWFNTEHTISLIKNPELKRPAWETLKLVRNKFLELNHDAQ
ncbi:MAG TPA: uracil-DNA glycosylase family protein [Spirochaetota bacterium]|nr:uracil-DNA glycosylase family protein [Spirochaetota bacterium]HPS87475.1 uracil-DNA glycosylase family protein [Spirochaetota bacterium]